MRDEQTAIEVEDLIVATASEARGPSSPARTRTNVSVRQSPDVLFPLLAHADCLGVATSSLTDRRSVHHVHGHAMASDNAKLKDEKRGDTPESIGVGHNF